MVGCIGGKLGANSPSGLPDFLNAVKILMYENEVPSNHDLLFNVISGHRMFSL